MELFRSIFAESSSESESEEQEDMSTTHSSVVAVETTPSKTVNSNKTGTAVNENRPPRQWQNLALLTLPSQPSTSLPPHHPSDTPFFTPTQAEKKTSERVEPPRQVSTNKVRSL